MEVYARVRRAVQVDGMSVRQAAREFGLSRKTIRKMLAFSVPPGYRRKGPAKRPKLGPWLGVIDQILEDDESQPKKQRHTAKRIYDRLKEEHRFGGRLHHREGLRARCAAAAQGSVCAVGASAGRCAGRLWRGAGGDRRGGAEGALPVHGSAAFRRLLRGGVSGREHGVVLRGAQPGVRLLRRGAADHAVRQHQASR